MAGENHVYHMDSPNTLVKFIGATPGQNYAASLARKLVTLCVTLNEVPSIRFQGTSSFCREMATLTHQQISEFKRSNPTFWCHGDEAHPEREKAQLLILDRSFDPLSPLMHEYTYQAMVNDLLPVKDNVIAFQTEGNGGQKVDKKALLGEADELWVELRHQHIAKVIEQIKEKMNDIIQNNAGAALAKGNGGDMSITKMAAAVKELPEYRETMSRLSQHVALAQQCMDIFGRTGLMDLSQLEQTMSTGVDEEGKEVKGARLVTSLNEALRTPGITLLMKIRLIAIFIITQGRVAPDDKRQLYTAAALTVPEQQILENFERLGAVLQEAQGPAAKGSSLLSMFKGKAGAKIAATAEGAYSDTRHLCRLRAILEQLMGGELPADKFPALGRETEGKAAAKSVRRYGSNSRWGGKKDHINFVGGRFLVFIAGGVAYSELRTASDLMTASNKEVVIGGTQLMNPLDFVKSVASLHASSANVFNDDRK